MEPGVILKIPEICYISLDPSRDFPFPFSFTATHGYLPQKDILPFSASGAGIDTAGGYPQITISGFDKLLSADKISAFINSLVISDTDWTIKKSGSSSDIVIRYGELELEPDFGFYAHTDKFIADTTNNKLVTLTVSVKNFPDIKDNSYIIGINVRFAPWAKSISFSQSPAALNSTVEVYYEYDGDDVDKILFQEAKNTGSARSPYIAEIGKPSLFSLRAFNTVGGAKDELERHLDVLPPEIKSFEPEKYYFSEGEPVNLSWNIFSYSSFDLAGIGPKDKIHDTGAAVYPETAPGNKTVTYRLTAGGYINQRPGITSRDLTLTKTAWKNTGAVSGFFAGDVYKNLPQNTRVHAVKEKLYAYAHPKLYESGTGLSWIEFSYNDKVAGSFTCLATECDGKIFYAMGRSSEFPGKLFITLYDFAAKVWSYASAYQEHHSDIGSFAFSRSEKAYAQTVERGMSIVQCAENGQWNGASSIIIAESGKTVVSGDYCFFKDRYYSAMLCSDGYVYIYDCSDSMEEYLFKKNVSPAAKWVAFVATGNNLYLLTANAIIEMRSQSVADVFSPLGGDDKSRPWLGTDVTLDLCGIFPDKNYWRFIT